jgi:hypothetical protein
MSKWLEFLSLSLSLSSLPASSFSSLQSQVILTPAHTSVCFSVYRTVWHTNFEPYFSMLSRHHISTPMVVLCKWQLLTSLPIIASTTISINEADSILHIRTCYFKLFYWCFFTKQIHINWGIGWVLSFGMEKS